MSSPNLPLLYRILAVAHIDLNNYQRAPRLGLVYGRFKVGMRFRVGYRGGFEVGIGLATSFWSIVELFPTL